MAARARLVMVALVVAFGTTSFGSQPVPMVLIEYPGAVNTRPMGINNRGDVVGIYVNPDSRTHGFLLDHKGEFTSIDVPAAIQTNAQRINSKGDVVGFYNTAPGRSRGFLLRHGTLSDVYFPGSFLTTALGINSRGDIVGQYNDVGGPPRHGYLLSQGTYVPIDYPGALRSVAIDINDRGDIVGMYVDTAGATHMYLLADGEFTSVDVPGALGTGSLNSVAGSNNKGEIAGGYLWTDMKVRGFLKDADGFHTIDFPDTMQVTPKSINERGDIVGFYRDLGNRDHGFLVRR